MSFTSSFALVSCTTFSVRVTFHSALFPASSLPVGGLFPNQSQPSSLRPWTSLCLREHVSTCCTRQCAQHWSSLPVSCRSFSEEWLLPRVACGRVLMSKNVFFSVYIVHFLPCGVFQPGILWAKILVCISCEDFFCLLRVCVCVSYRSWFTYGYVTVFVSVTLVTQHHDLLTRRATHWIRGMWSQWLVYVPTHLLSIIPPVLYSGKFSRSNNFAKILAANILIPGSQAFASGITLMRNGRGLGTGGATAKKLTAKSAKCLTPEIFQLYGMFWGSCDCTVQP